MFCKTVFNKFDAKKGDSSLVTARSKYHLHVNEWEKAVSDARAVLEESSNTAQAYLSKVEGLFNLCWFEEVIFDSISDYVRTFIKALVTSKRGEQNQMGIKLFNSFRQWFHTVKRRCLRRRNERERAQRSKNSQ